MIFVDIEKDYGAFQLRIQFEAGDEVLALLGASGSGKSLTLKAIAGIEKPDKGRIVLNDRVLFDSDQGINLTPQERQVGLMFQNYALFPNMTVEENIRLGARRSLRPEKAIQAMIEAFRLESVRRQKPETLSGGQQQRVALARMLVSDPQIMLLDEPFSALDIHLRYQLEREMAQSIAQFGKTVILVSHDRDEVYRLSDRIAIMEGGLITRQGEKKAVFNNPMTLGGARLTGCKNISRLSYLSDRQGYALDWDMTLDLPQGDLSATHVGIRMHDITDRPSENPLDMEIVSVIENPFSFVYSFKYTDKAKLSIGWEVKKQDRSYVVGSKCRVYFPLEKILMLKGK